MHPALSMNKLSNLPPRTQRLARKVVEPTATLQDTLRLRDHLQQLPGHQQPSLLPIFYMTLDQEHIPSLDQLDSPVPLSNDHISRVYTSLLAVYALPNLPPDVFAVIFPRIVLWVQFLQTYCHYLDLAPCLPHGVPPSQNEICFTFFLFIGTFLDDEASTQTINRTLGVRFLVGRAWTFLVQSRNPTVLRIAFPDLTAFILHLVRDDPSRLQEFMDGIGEKLADVATLVMQSLQIVLGDNAFTGSMPDSYALHGIISLMANIDFMLVPEEESEILGPLSELLLARGIVKTLTLGARRAMTTVNVDVISACLALLSRIFSTRPGYASLPASIQDGLLDAIVFCGTCDIDTASTPHFPIILGTILPTSLAYYAVLSVMEKALREVTRTTSAMQFRRSAMFDQWQDFIKLAHKRLGVLHSFNSRVGPSLKACDNVQCDQIGEKTAFKRCAECLRVYYCSEACQTVDWSQGGHRDTCETYHVIGLGKQDSLSPRGRAFLRALLHHDYVLSKADIYLKVLGFMHRHPDTRFVVWFDYTGSLNITVEPFDSAMEILYAVDASSPHAGRLELHVMQVGLGGGKLSRELPRAQEEWDMDVVAGKVRSVLSRVPANAIEIH
ncbi:hypothetical protein B0H17DRAFT_1217093 [Mycena rosella]|uniref:MYND-type domain-containing protein n=1 Tax=Mycena rosella TaxID=1033263 RepID=A0AAD7C2U4_MYCRO|nr:hypothetical protein B0H17DRAFT_1217093 [Mycena rosella]